MAAGFWSKVPSGGSGMKELEPKAELFERVVDILDNARANVVRSINSSMVTAYWLIGREIVLEIQGGEDRAEYGKKVIAELSGRLLLRFQNGFSITNLQYFRKFYQTYPDRIAIQHPTGAKSEMLPIRHPMGKEFEVRSHLSQPGRDGRFHPHLGWSHYRALMRVDDAVARVFYEQEAAECGWSKDQLERQIHTSYYQRILANQGPTGLISGSRDRLPGESIPSAQVLKSPLVLEFLELPDSKELRESTLEQAIIDNLQSFMLELGKGFSFVSRQRHIRFGDDDFYVDLVFYNYLIKCFLLVDLKIGKLNHRDVGQMDGYVRLFEDRFKVDGDNPTIGLILCSDKSEAVAKYSVLSEGRQIFASKYLQFLPSEKELMLAIEKERKQIEAALAEKRVSRPSPTIS
jgi:predicted nuclease of restriction endonuclease-like (RecB) superfamily